MGGPSLGHRLSYTPLGRGNVPACLYCGNSLEEGTLFCPKCLRTQVAFPTATGPGANPATPVFAGMPPSPAPPTGTTPAGWVLTGGPHPPPPGGAPPAPPPPPNATASPPMAGQPLSIYNTPPVPPVRYLSQTPVAGPLPMYAPPAPPPPTLPPPADHLPVPPQLAAVGKRCPFCNNIISRSAVVCPVCATRQPEGEAVQPAPPVSRPLPHAPAGEGMAAAPADAGSAPR